MQGMAFPAGGERYGLKSSICMSSLPDAIATVYLPDDPRRSKISQGPIQRGSNLLEPVRFREFLTQTLSPGSYENSLNSRIKRSRDFAWIAETVFRTDRRTESISSNRFSLERLTFSGRQDGISPIAGGSRPNTMRYGEKGKTIPGDVLV